MQVGIVLPIAHEDDPPGVAEYPVIRDIALTAEAVGLDSVWVFDHLMFRDDEGVTGIHECWTILAAIAEATERVTLGTIVMATSFRNAALLAKMAATLDHVSAGRLILGIGSGWYQPEYEAFGYPFDHRVSRFEEALTIILALIREGRADLDGQWMTVRDVVLVPPARPDLPILVASRGPRMMDLAARHADAWNAAWFGLPNDRLAGRRADLEVACERVGRDPSTLSISVGLIVQPGGDEATESDETALRGTPRAIAAGLAAHAALGADHAIVVLEPSAPDTVRALGEAVALYREMAITPA